MDFENIIYALVGGIIPALLWLYFWLKEDSLHPEPKKLIGRTFLYGMLAVILVLPFEKLTEEVIQGKIIFAVIIWAILEEIFKWTAAYFGGLRTKDDNEPIDPIIYMITAALGFVALENALFILGPLVGQDVPRSLFTANFRFIGASLLHVVSSGLIGIGYSFSFYKSKNKKIRNLILGTAGAIIFHILFNLLILKMSGVGTLYAFSAVWIGVIFLLWSFERAKSIASRSF